MFFKSDFSVEVRLSRPQDPADGKQTVYTPKLPSNYCATVSSERSQQ